jgi:glycosyltransferase involved in cell wall biosynthesis
MFFSHSILLPVFNGQEFLEQQIVSILNEMEPTDELIIYDDGSSDDSLLISVSFAENDIRVRIFKSAHNGGLRRAVNFLLKEALNELIVFVDQDDVWLPGRLKEVQVYFPQNDCVVVNAELCDSGLVPCGRTYFDLVGLPVSFFDMFLRCRVLGCCMIFKKSCLNGVLTIPRGCWHDHFIILWLMLMKKSINFHHEPLVLYRRHNNALSKAGTSTSFLRTAPSVILNRVVLLGSVFIRWANNALNKRLIRHD